MGVDVHGGDYTKAAERAVSDAIRHSSLNFFAAAGKERDDMQIEAVIAVADPDALDHDRIKAQLPYGTVTVTATPISVTWDPGDGSASVVCDDAGVAWQPGLGDDDTDCSYTYTQSSAGEADDAYRLSATVAWDLTWTINGIDQGRFATYEPTTTVDHRVGEIQSVGSG